MADFSGRQVEQGRITSTEVRVSNASMQQGINERGYVSKGLHDAGL